VEGGEAREGEERRDLRARMKARRFLREIKSSKGL